MAKAVKGEKRLSMKQKNKLAGYGFIAPWLLGVSMFFLVPMGLAVVQLFTTFSNTTRQYTFVGFTNLRAVFFEDAENIRLMLDSLGTTLGEALLIVAFSLFAAILLNQKFKGRGFSRAVFALPIIVSSGVLMAIFREDLFRNTMMDNAEATIFQSDALYKSLLNMGLPVDIVTGLTDTVSRILDIVWKTGVQILLFLGGLQAVSPQLYEVCQVEGATAWQKFWKVTFPLLSPFLLLNTVYSVIDSFTYYSNPVMGKVNRYFMEYHHSYSTSLAFPYFLLVLIITGIIAGLMSRKIFYIEK